VLEATLQSLDAYHRIKALLKWDGTILSIGENRWDFRRKRRIYVIGAGKACNAMARAVDEILGDRITEGLVIVKGIEAEDTLKHIELATGGHPLPNHEGWKASQRILDLVNQSTPDDLFIVMISGGSSALMSCPVEGITLEDERIITDQLLKSSARILEINAIRRHVSETNGGRLAQKIEAKGAEMINLIISDSVGDYPTLHPEQHAKFFGTPAAPDGTTLDDARNVLRKYDLFSRAPQSILKFLATNDPFRETPKSFGSRVYHFVLGGVADSCEAAKQAAHKFSLPSLVLTTFLQGESREAGVFLASITREILLNHRPLPPPCVLITSGETTTRIEGSSGQGGPSQELALSFGTEISRFKGIGMIAIDTDGTDGPTEIAGGIVDCLTVERAKTKGLDLYEYLKAHDSSSALKILGDEVMTGNTGTNVCDLNVIYIS
jgi:glycerate 2-kinase